MRAVLLLVALARLAHADVGVLVGGEPVMQAPVLSQVQGWLQDGGFRLVAAPLGTMVGTFTDCFVMEDMKCARGVFEAQSRADSLVFVRVDLIEGRDFTLTAYWFVKKHAASVEKRTCRTCDDAALHRTVAELMEPLSKRSGLGKGHLSILPGAAGVIVELDGVPLGTAPIERDLAPGPHELRFLRAGRSVGAASVTIRPGAAVELAVPREDTGEDTGEGASSRLVPALLLAGGVALVTSGAIALSYGQKGGPDEPYIYTNATEIGIGLAVAGTGAFVAGAILWMTASRTSRPTVALTSGGASVGWVGAF
jgi:hypothetical protein